MDIFGIVIGQYLIALLLGVLLASFGFSLLRWGWVGKFVGLLLFSGACGWITSLLLHQDSQRVDGRPVAVIVTFLAAVLAATVVWQNKDSQRPAFGRGPQLNRNTIIGGLLVGVVVITAFSYLASGSIGLFDIDDPAAQQAYDQSTDGTKRYVNRFLRAVDTELAK